MKSDNPGGGDMYFDVPDRSVIVPGLGEPQNHEFWGVFMVGKFSKKKNFFFPIIFQCFMGQNFSLISFF